MPLSSAFFRGLRPLTWAGAARDALAGVSLASMNIPQVLGYARIAGMPLVTGLYTIFLPLIAFATFGSSRHLVVSADSATAVIFASRLSTMAPSASPHYVELVGIVALLTAALLLLARIFKLGFLADFLSRTVLVGFLAGVGIQVGVAMLGDMLGIPTAHSDTIERIDAIGRAAARTHLPSLALSAAVVAIILACKRWLPRAPVSLLLVIAAIAASYIFDFAGHGIPIVGAVPEGLPSLAFPKVDRRELLALLPVAASCFVVIMAQSAAAARAFAERHHERFDENADILGLSAANAVAALSGTFVVNGSPTQTAMADRAGAASQFANLVSAATVVLVLLFFTRPLRYLPHCVLASIVFTIAVGLIDVKRLRDMRTESPGEFTLAVLTAAAVALVGVEQGILLAIALSLLRHVSHSYTASHQRVRRAGGRTLEAGRFDAGRADRARAHRLSIQCRSVLRERQPFCRSGARTRGACAVARSMVRRGCGSDHRSRLFGGTHRPRSVRRARAQGSPAGVRTGHAVPACRHGPPRPHGGARQ